MSSRVSALSRPFRRYERERERERDLRSSCLQNEKTQPSSDSPHRYITNQHETHAPFTQFPALLVRNTPLSTRASTPSRIPRFIASLVAIAITPLK